MNLLTNLLMNFVETVYWFLQPGNWPLIFTVAAGLGFVIFVHELGHFAVAKWCGVRCDKFYVGFDIPFGRFFDWLMELTAKVFRRDVKINFFNRFVPRTLGKIKVGETEYGIGIVPLGGYVKMLGQDDDPSKAAEEMALLQRQRAAEAAGKPLPPEEQIPLERIRELQDPTSYVTKSVPQRLAIITAGVIMNIIFAFLMATLAYWLGINKATTIIGQAIPGGPAWKAGLRPGDEITAIGGEETKYFEDIQTQIVYKGAAANEALPFTIKRPGVDKPFDLPVTPEQADKRKLAPMVMIGIESSLQYAGVSPYTPLGQAQRRLTKDAVERLRDGDQLVAVDGEKITDNRAWQKLLDQRRSEALRATFSRPAQNTDQPPTTFELVIPPLPTRDVGLTMTLGPVTAMQTDSPAKQAGVKEGDQLLSIDDAPIGDPLELPALLNQRAAGPIKLTVRRGQETMTLTCEPRTVDWFESWGGHKGPLPLSTLGMTCDISPIVTAVRAGSSAAKAGIKAGDQLVSYQFLEPAEPPPGKLFRRESDIVTLGGGKIQPNALYFNWVEFHEQLQYQDPTRKIRFVVLTDSTERTVELAADTVADRFERERGIMFESIQTRVQYPLSEAVVQGLKVTGQNMVKVVYFLRQLFRGGIKLTALGGPGAIAGAAGTAAEGGFSQLLFFLVMLSANLAVVNILPIPMLDGGHVVFLIYEWITGKPMPAGLYATLLNIGVSLIMSLMLFVVALDIGLIPRFW